MSEKDQYDGWRRLCAGEKVEIFVNAEDALPGFYRTRNSDGTFDAISIFLDEHGKLIFLRNNKEVAGSTVWPSCVKRWITYSVYEAVVERGEPWPDLNEAVTRSNEAPPDDSFEALSEAIRDLARDADAAIKGGAATEQSAADNASDLANKLGELWKKANAARAAEKKEHDDAAARVQGKWLPVLNAAEIFKRLKAVVVAPFLVAKDNAEQAARAAAAQAGTPQPERQRGSTTKAGTRSRPVSLRTVKDVEIIDRAAVLAYFADGIAMGEFLQNSAERAVRAGVSVPGTKVTERKVAA